VLVREGDEPDTLAVRSVLLLYRHRGEFEVEQFCGHCDDVLRRVDEVGDLLADLVELPNGRRARLP